MAKFWPEANDAERSRVADRYRFYYRGADETPSTLFPGARELVDWLLQRDYLLAVATGKNRRSFDPILGDTGLADRFTSPGAPMRPAPSLIRKCCCNSWMSWE